jgi:hypothetical protein
MKITLLEQTKKEGVTDMRKSGFWRPAILASIKFFGGRAHMPDVYSWIQKNRELSEREKSTSPHQGRPYYLNTVRGIASDMCNKGLLVRISDGYYRLA